MPPKADTSDEDQRSTGSTISGKLVIIAIVAVALTAATTSWWVRYSSTHRAAGFWGPQAATLIRDAKRVELHRIDPAVNSTSIGNEPRETLAILPPFEIRDVAAARGLVHLRNALLDDRSFGWPPGSPTPDMRWAWSLHFHNGNSEEGVYLHFSPDCKFVAAYDHPIKVLSCAPIATGLAEMFAEMSQEPAAPPR